MADIPVQAHVSDEDLASAIDEIIVHYPPLTNDRHFFMVEVQNGQVTVRGYARTAITRAYLVDRLRQMPGIMNLDVDQFYSDDLIRLAVGKVVPAGVLANVNHGAVILSGQLPAGVEPEMVIAAVHDVPGVRAVHSPFARI